MPGDEELGKKDDDHKPGAAPRLPPWLFSNTPLRWRRRRILLAVVGLYLVYVFLKNTPDLGEWSGQRTTSEFGRPIVPMTNEDYNRAYDVEPTGPPPGMRAPKAGEPIPHTFDGPIKFYRLATSLHGSSHTNGYRAVNRNIVFAMSSLKSASTLLPIICEMSKWSRNWVHAAFMGREDIELAEILEINGIDQAKCPAIWHDARSDYSEYSTDTRAENSVISALTHIHSFLHPQVAIVDDALVEDNFFNKGIRAKTKALAMPLIEIPKDRWESFMWATRLDAGSLKHWNHPTVDILIQVPSDSSSVLRLLKSLKTADYSGLDPPRLTIELPADVDKYVEAYLENFKWPPHSDQSRISIRRRIANQRVSQEESAIRFLELFYPSNRINSHVLLLSPMAELSSQFYQYLMYVLLEYKYSSFGLDDAANIMGVSLEVPSVLLDGKTKLNPPKITDMHTTRYEELFPETQSAPFLWQAPNCHATLFFGDKWKELHEFLSNRVAKHHQAPDATPRHKLVSETLPAWVEYMQEFMRARGYALFYPGSSSTDSFVTIHNELYHPPEEFLPRKPSESLEESAAPAKRKDEPFLRAEEPAPPPKYPETHVIPYSRPLHLALPFDGDLPEIPHLPYLLHNGKTIPLSNVTDTAKEYANKYREVIGGCKIPDGKHRKIVSGSTRDLFCFGDEEDSDWENDVEEVFDADVVDEYHSTISVSKVLSSSALATPTTESFTASRTIATTTASLQA